MFTKTDLDFLDGETFDPTTDNLDGMETFDPKGAIIDQNRKNRGIFNGTVGKDGIITLRVKNRTANRKKFELFNSLKSISKIPNSSQYDLFGNYVPLSSGYIAANLGLQGVDPPIASSNEYILPDFALFNDASGSLVYVDAALFKSPVGTAIKAVLNAGGNINWDLYADVIVSCQQLPYRQLVDSFQSMVWRVSKTKLQASSENQIKNAFNFEYFSPLGGSEKNSFEPSEFFLPQNQQTKVIDIPYKYEVDANTAIYVELEPNEDLQITFFIRAFRNNAVKW
jgi:hypothetical protein